MTKKELRYLRKCLAEKWALLIDELGAAKGKTLAYYDDGEDVQKAAIEEIKRLKTQPISLERLMQACPRDVIKKLSCHDLKRITDNYNADESNDKIAD